MLSLVELSSIEDSIAALCRSFTCKLLTFLQERLAETEGARLRLHANGLYMPSEKSNSDSSLFWSRIDDPKSDSANVYNNTEVEIRDFLED